MATTAPPPSASHDLSGVTKTLDLLAPRWSVWVLMTLSSQTLRYAEIKPRLPWLADGQLHPRLRHLASAGVVERTEYAPRHVTYGLTSRGAALMPVLATIASWGDTYLEKDLVANKATGEMEPERIPPAQNIDDALALIVPRHATPILWSLQTRGSATAKSLATEAMPGYGLTAVYKPLERLAEDGLITANGSGDYQLSASGRALSPCSRRSPPGPPPRPPRPMPAVLGDRAWPRRRTVPGPGRPPRRGVRPPHLRQLPQDGQPAPP